MNSFEKHYDAAKADSAKKAEEARNRVQSRREAQERRRRQTCQIMALLGAICMVLAALLTLLAAAAVPLYAEAEVPAEAAGDGSVPGDATPATTSCLLSDEEVEAAENEMIEAALLARANVIENCTVTHYDCCVECCGKADGITATGVRATPGVTVAVDPDVIPLGSDVLVDYGDGEIHYYRAEDVGGSITGNHIDLCVSSHEEADRLGIRTATVY